MLSKLLRKYNFQRRCLTENLLKVFFRNGESNVLTWNQIKDSQQGLNLSLRLSIKRLKAEQLIQKTQEGFKLTPKGTQAAEKIHYLHRLFAIYLASEFKTSQEKVYCSSDEMEKIFTPEIEKQLLALADLKGPRRGAL